jgi:hypothetical protein
MADCQRFVIVSCPRTGSTHLVDYLEAIDGVRCLSEVFNERMVLLRHHRPVDPRLEEMGFRNSDPLGFLTRLEREVGDCGWFGFKLFPNQNLPLLQQLCADRRWRKIFLWRDNLVEQYLSFLLAASHFGRKEWGRVPDASKFSASTADLIRDVHTIENNYQVIEKALAHADPGGVFALEYEELARRCRRHAPAAPVPGIAAGRHRDRAGARRGRSGAGLHAWPQQRAASAELRRDPRRPRARPLQALDPALTRIRHAAAGRNCVAKSPAKVMGPT